MQARPSPFRLGTIATETFRFGPRWRRRLLALLPGCLPGPSRLAQAAPGPFSLGPSSARALLAWPEQRPGPFRFGHRRRGAAYLCTGNAEPLLAWHEQCHGPFALFSVVFSVFLPDVRAFEAGFALTLGLELPGSLNPWPKDRPCGPALTENGAAEEPPGEHQGVGLASSRATASSTSVTTIWASRSTSSAPSSDDARRGRPV
jgi:hypothetical protein